MQCHPAFYHAAFKGGVQLLIFCVPQLVGVAVESSIADITCIAKVTLYYLLNYLNLPL